MTPGAPFGALVAALTAEMARRGAEALRPLAVSVPQWKLLAALDAAGPSRVSALVAVLGVDQASVSRTLKRLEVRGWVRRGADGADARATLAALTPAGRKLAQRCGARLQAVADSFQAQVGPEEWSTFLDLLARVARPAGAPTADASSRARRESSGPSRTGRSRTGTRG